MKTNIEDVMEEYIVVKKSEFMKHGLIKAMILQLLKKCGGNFVGTIGSVSKIIEIVSYTTVKNALYELRDLGYIDMKIHHGCSYKFSIKKQDKQFVITNNVDTFVTLTETGAVWCRDNTSIFGVEIIGLSPITATSQAQDNPGINAHRNMAEHCRLLLNVTVGIDLTMMGSKVAARKRRAFGNLADLVYAFD